MAKREGVAPPALIKEVIANAGRDLVLIGGQALAYWILHYRVTVPAHLPAVSRDIDFLGQAASDQASVRRLARRFGKAWLPGDRGLTALVGRVVVELPDDEYTTIDIVHKIAGFRSADTVRERAVTVTLSGVDMQVMHPLDVLRSRMVNLHKLEEKQSDLGMTQLRLAIEVGRAFLAEVAAADTGGGRPAVLRFIKAIHAFAREGAGRSVAERFGIHVADAIDPSLIRTPEFWREYWPAVKPLMSSEYAAGFAQPELREPPSTRRHRKALK